MTFNNGINADKASYGHGRKFINVLDILNNNSITYDDIIGSVSVSEKSELNNKVEYGDLLFLRSSETREDVGKSSVYLDANNFALFGGFVIRGKKIGQYNPYFLKLLLESPNVRNQISSKAGGSTRFNVSQSILSSVEVTLPSESEQSQIAQFFQQLDRKIKLQQEKIDCVKKQKKGFIQKIFNQELRFKDDDDKEPQEWKTVTLKDIIENKFKGKNADYVEQLSDGNILLHNEFLEYGINPLYVSEKANVQKEHVLILWDGSQAGNVFFNQEGVLGSTFVALKFLPEINVEFIGHQLQHLESTIKKSWREGSGVPHISKSFINQFKIKICSLKEQEKISGFLSCFDNKIKSEQLKLFQLESQKKALMQQLFI